jgi:predicted AAA+ superfamily ATPase
MERKLMTTLIQWKDSKGRKPLLLEGARQVGKTTEAVRKRKKA